MKDINSRQDIELLVDSFYEQVRQDATIGYFFMDVVKVDWAHHLPKMYDFWENVLFQADKYHGNPMHIHKLIAQQSPIEYRHLDHWVALFHATVDTLFAGKQAEQIKQRALSIATVMKVKVAC